MRPVVNRVRLPATPWLGPRTTLCSPTWARPPGAGGRPTLGQRPRQGRPRARRRGPRSAPGRRAARPRRAGCTPAAGPPTAPRAAAGSRSPSCRRRRTGACGGRTWSTSWRRRASRGRGGGPAGRGRRSAAARRAARSTCSRPRRPRRRTPPRSPGRAGGGRRGTPSSSRRYAAPASPLASRGTCRCRTTRGCSCAIRGVTDDHPPKARSPTARPERARARTARRNRSAGPGVATRRKIALSSPALTDPGTAPSMRSSRVLPERPTPAM